MKIESSAPEVRRQNALGFLRLLFASIVIASHVPELVDGNRHRELLFSLIGYSSLATIGVYGFFIISGFLISKSFFTSSSLAVYLLKRIARIYPGFVAASLVCIFVVAPLAGADLSQLEMHSALAALVRMAILARPVVEGTFAGQVFHGGHSSLDGAMWTIQFEFACYLMVMVFGFAGLLRSGVSMVVIAIVCLVLAVWMPEHGYEWLQHEDLFASAPSTGFTLFSMFFAGTAFARLAPQFPWSSRGALIAIVGLIGSAVHPVLLAFGVASFGTYLIFGVAEAAGDSFISGINRREDISYGVYLYGWPIEQLLIRYLSGSHLALLFVMTWSSAIVLGTASWFLVERPLKL